MISYYVNVSYKKDDLQGVNQKSEKKQIADKELKRITSL